MDIPKVSICIPSYNHARFLPATLESALSQTYRNIEIVVVDDGSTDESLQIAEEYSARHPSLIKVYTHSGRRNRGISATVNLGFKKASGYYYSGLPSDDILHPEKIARQVAFLESRPNAGFVYSYARLIDEHGQELPGIIGVDISTDTHPVERMLEANAIPGPTVLARRAAIEKIFPHDEKLIYSDWDFWTRFVTHYEVGFLPEPLVLYRVHSYNTSIGHEEVVEVKRTLEVMETLREKAPAVGGELAQPRCRALLAEKITALRQRLFELYLHKYHCAAQAGQISHALSFFWKATRLAPSEFLHPRRLTAEFKNGLFGVANRARASLKRPRREG